MTVECCFLFCTIAHCQSKVNTMKSQGRLCTFTCRVYLFASPVGNYFFCRPHENIYNKIYDALISCNFYLNALSNERCSFEYAANNGADDANKEMMEENVFSSVVDVKKNFQILTEKAWKGFAEVSFAELQDCFHCMEF